MKSSIPVEKAETLHRGKTSVVSIQDAGSDIEKNVPSGDTSPVYSKSRNITLDPDELEKNRCVCITPTSSEISYYKVLRTQIQQRCKENGWKTVMVTSAQAGEGKTLTAINLAITFAKEFNQTALLVDCDFKKQDVHRYLHYDSDRNLIDYLMDDIPIEELIVWPSVDKLTLISGERTIHDGSELLGSPRMKALVEEMKSRYDDRYVFFDVPPILNTADTIAFAPLVDCILMVAEKGRTKKSDIKRAIDLIPREKLIGVVMNCNGDMRD